MRRPSSVQGSNYTKLFTWSTWLVIVTTFCVSLVIKKKIFTGSGGNSWADSLIVNLRLYCNMGKWCVAFRHGLNERKCPMERYTLRRRTRTSLSLVLYCSLRVKLSTQRHLFFENSKKASSNLNAISINVGITAMRVVQSTTLSYWFEQCEQNGDILIEIKVVSNVQNY